MAFNNFLIYKYALLGKLSRCKRFFDTVVSIFSSYIVMFPKTIRPNLETNVNVQLLNPTPGLDTTVVVSLLDENNATLVSETRTTGN